MWDDIDFMQETTQDLKWVAEGMQNNTLLWTTDGSYDRKQAADLFGMGWIIFCKRIGLRMTGTFWEKTPSASLFRAEMLGLCCLHLLARAVAEFFGTNQWEAVISCDNKRALELSSNHWRRIQLSAKCADIRCSFWATKQVFTRGFKYVHIYGHMDQFLSWSQLSLMQQLKCVCDTLAKKAILTTIISGYHDRPTQILPREDVALVIWGNKLTGDTSTPLRFHASKELARNYLSTRTRDKWPNECFDEVDWEHLELALKNKADMYKVWRSKQTSGFCETQVMVGMYSGEALPDEQCPNCGRRELAAHLMLCPDKDRTRLLIENVDELSKWLDTDSRTDPELAYWIPIYILMQGDKPFLTMGYMSPKLKALAESQDCIGWKNFTKGHISTKFYEIQTFHLAMSSSYLNGSDWTKQFITKILQIMHSQ